MNYRIKLVGVTPYMQHRMDDVKLTDWEKQRGAIIERDHLAEGPELTAGYHSYIDKEGRYYMPAEHFKQSFIAGGGYVKGKVGNATRSMKNIVAGMWRIKEDKIFLPKFDEVDSRSAVNKNVKARIMVHRPKWLNWEAEFTLMIDEDEKNKLTIETVENIIKYAGRYLGVGSYRPQHTGEFGRFNIVSIEKIIDKE